MFRLFTALILILIAVTKLTAQENIAPVYFANAEYIFRQSQIGQEFLRRQEARQNELQALDEEMSTFLLEEENRLTELREEMSLEEFQPIADEFNQTAENERNKIDKQSESYKVELEFQQGRLRDLILSEILRFSQERNNITILDARFALAIDPNNDVSQIIISRLDANYLKNKPAIDELIFAPYDESSQLSTQTDIEN